MATLFTAISLLSRTVPEALDFFINKHVNQVKDSKSGPGSKPALLPPIHCVTLGKSFNFSEPQFSLVVKCG